MSNQIEEFQGIKITNGIPQIMTFVGSSRFCGLMAVMMWEFEKLGIICMGLHLLPNDYCKQAGFIPDENGHIHHIGEQQGVENEMDALHFKKIEMSDSIYVINFEGYIGFSTAREIAYAKHLGKRITYHETPPQNKGH